MPLASSDIAKKRDTVVRAHVDAENRHDLAAVIATFHQPKYEVMGRHLDLRYDGPLRPTGEAP